MHLFTNSIAPAVLPQYLYRPTAWRSTDKTNRPNEPSSKPADRPTKPNKILFTHTPSYYLKIHFNIILPSTTKRFQWFLYLKYSPLHLICTILVTHLYLIHRSSHSSWFDQKKSTLKSKNIRWGLWWWSRFITSSSHPLPPPYSVHVSSSTPYNRTCSACSFLNARALVSHPHKTGKLIVPCFIKFITFDSNGTILPNGRSIPSVQYALRFFTNDSHRVKSC